MEPIKTEDWKAFGIHDNFNTAKQQFNDWTALENHYIIKCGKYGLYFYDTINQKDVTLEEACRIMNGLP